MATYKVPQNVEAEDKLLGPFSFRQFIYLMIASMAIFMAWLLARVNGWMVLIPMPVIIAFAILGLYHREDQPVETYLLAAINFLIKPRRRLWNPEGNVENVKITAPKKAAPPQTKHFEQSQLERLAHVIDTRGWYVKRPELQEPIVDAFSLDDDDDRLINPTMQVSQDPIDVHETDDILSTGYPEVEDYQHLAERSHSQAIAHAKAQMQMAASQPQKVGTSNLKLDSTNQLPTKVKYDPYPTGTQHTLDPVSGQYATTAHIAAIPTVPLKSLPKQLKVSQVAKVVNKAKPLTAGTSTDIGSGGEATLRPSKK